jgi:hypothetical protein
MAYPTWDEVEWNFSDRRGWKKKIKDAKAWPVTDIGGWLADELYNDKPTMSDLVGDRIHDEARGRCEDQILIAQEMIELGAHNALQKALEEHVKRWRRMVREARKRQRLEDEAAAYGDSQGPCPVK